jgi:hypothetical protein
MNNEDGRPKKVASRRAICWAKRRKQRSLVQGKTPREAARGSLRGAFSSDRNEDGSFRN